MPKEQNEIQAEQSVETILLISGILTLLEKFIPKIKEWTEGGVITKEVQDEIRARYDKLAGNLDEAFGGDHWKVRPDPEPPASRSSRSTETAGTIIKNKSGKPTDGSCS